MNTLKLLTLANEFMMNIETYTADWYLKYSVEDPENNYIRAQTISEVGMDKIDKKSIANLLTDGQKLWDENSVKI